MIINSRGKRLWIVDETGQTQPVHSYKDITGKPRGRHLPDWWVEEKEPDWTPEPGMDRPLSLLRLGMAQNDEEARKTSPRMPKDGFETGASGKGIDVLDLAPVHSQGHGTGMKIGAGHKPQPYDDHGRYTGPTGASISMDGGTIRTFSANAEEPEEWQGNEPEGGQEGGQEESAQDAQQRVEEMARELQRAADELEADRQQAQGANKPLEGVLIADSGQIKSDAGGLSGGPEVRGPVTGPSEWREPLQQREDQAQRVPTSVFWKNREEAHGLKPQMNDAVNSMRQDVPKMDSVFVSSGRREALGPGDPHAEGRGLDISKINGHPVWGMETSTAPGADRAREAAANLEEWARENPNVNQFLGPTGCWERTSKGWEEITPGTPRNDALIAGHRDHFHINVFRQ